MNDAVVISDLHLGSPSCDVELLLHFLRDLPPTKRLVLNGDVLDSVEVGLSAPHWGVLALLQELTWKTRVTWVRGNHDYLAARVAYLVGATFVDAHQFKSGGVGALCVHGDTWDYFIQDRPILTYLADLAYRAMQAASPRWAARMKLRSKGFLRCAARVRAGALGLAHDEKCGIVVCGHTHLAEDATPGAVQYLNPGAWTEPGVKCVFVKDGKAWLEDVK